MWINTPTWKWLKPFVLRSTSFPIENVLKFRLNNSKHSMNQWMQEKENYHQWCQQWIEDIRNLPLPKANLNNQRKIIRRIKKKNVLTKEDKDILKGWGMCTYISRYICFQQKNLEAKSNSKQKFEEEISFLQEKLRLTFKSKKYDLALFSLNSKFWSFYSNSLTNKKSIGEKRQLCRTLFAYLQRVTTKNDTISEFGPISYGAFSTGVPNYKRKITNRKSFIAHQALQKILNQMRIDFKVKSNEWTLPSSSVDGLTVLKGFLTNRNKCNKVDKWEKILLQFEQLIVNFESAGSSKEKEKSMIEAEELFTRITADSYEGKNQQYFADKSLLYEECFDELSIPVIIQDDLWEDLDVTLIIHAKLCLEFFKNCQKTAIREFANISNGKNEIPLLKWVTYWLNNPPVLERKFFMDYLKPWVNEEQDYYSISVPKHIIYMWKQELASYRWMLSPDLMVKGKNVSKGFEVSSIVIGELHHGFTADGWMLYFHPESEQINKSVRNLIMENNQETTMANWVFKRTMKSTPQEYPGVSIELAGNSGASCKKVYSIKDLEVKLTGKTQLQVFIKGQSNPLMFYPPALGFRSETFFPFSLFSQPIFWPEFVADRGRNKPVKIGKVTFLRESWKFSPKDWMGKCIITDWYEQVIQLQEIKQKYQLPEVGFLRFSNEQKPVWFDFDNPFCVDLFFNLAKKAEWFTYSRMDPSVEELFIKDDHGHYCCELRTFAFWRKNKE